MVNNQSSYNVFPFADQGQIQIEQFNVSKKINLNRIFAKYFEIIFTFLLKNKGDYYL